MKSLWIRLGLKADDTRKLRMMAPIFVTGGMAESLLYTAFMSLFNSRLGVQYLPNIYMIEAFLIPLEAWLLAFLSTKMSKPVFMRLFFISLIGIVLINGTVLWWIRISHTNILWFYFVLFLSSNFVSRQLMILLWSLSADLLPTQQSKRLMPMFVTLTTIGGITAGGIAMLGPYIGGTEVVYVGAVMMLLVALPYLFRSIRVYLEPLMVRQQQRDQHQAEKDTGRWQGWGALRSPFLLVTVGVMTLMPALYFLMEYEYLHVAQATFPDENALTAFFGLMTTIQFTVVLLIQSASGKLLQWLGAANTILVITIFYSVLYFVTGFFIETSFALWLVSSSYIVIALLIEYYAEPSFPLFFKMLPVNQRDGVRYIAQGIANSAGILLGSGLQLLHTSGTLHLQVLSFTGGGIALLMTLLAWFGRTLYVEELLKSIKVLHTQLDESVSSFLGGMRNLKVVQAVASLLEHSNKLVREVALQILAKFKDPSMLSLLLGQLKDPSAKIRMAALRAITLEGTDIEELIQVAACLDDPDPYVRAEGVKLLGSVKQLKHQAHYFIRMKLLDDHPMVVSEGIIALYRLQSTSSYGACDEALEKMLEQGEEAAVYACRAIAECGLIAYKERIRSLLTDNKASVRSAAVQCLGALKDGEATDALLQLVPRADKELLRVILEALIQIGSEAETSLRKAMMHSNPAVWRASIFAITPLCTDEQVKSLLIESCLNRINWMKEQKQSVDTFIMVGEHELAYLAHQRYEEIRLIVMEGCWTVMERLTDQQVVKAVRATLDDTDPEVKDNGLEVLSEGLGEKKLAAAMMDIYSQWDDWQMEEVSYPHLKIQQLAEGDGDHWLKEIAQEIVERRESGMETNLQNLSLLDKIVFLKQITMFSDLSLEELGMIAEYAKEEVIQENTFIMEQGKPCMNLFVILEGHVELSSVSKNGVEGTIGVMSTKQFFGETTVLSSAPSTVSAQAIFDDVRVLTIQGDDLARLIRLYPEIGIGLLHASSTKIRMLEDMVLKFG